MADDQQSPRVRRDQSSILVGFVLLLLAGVLYYDTFAVDRAVTYGVGPTAMPKVVAIGLVILGILSIFSGVKGQHFEIESTDWRAVITIIGGFLLLTALIGLGGGFIPAMTALFAVTSFAFGRRAILADVAIGLVLSVAIYLLFSKLLALSLPRGPLENLLG